MEVRGYKIFSRGETDRQGGGRTYRPNRSKFPVEIFMEEKTRVSVLLDWLVEKNILLNATRDPTLRRVSDCKKLSSIQLELRSSFELHSMNMNTHEKKFSWELKRKVRSQLGCNGSTLRQSSKKNSLHAVRVSLPIHVRRLFNSRFKIECNSRGDRLRPTMLSDKKFFGMYYRILNGSLSSKHRHLGDGCQWRVSRTSHLFIWQVRVRINFYRVQCKLFSVNFSSKQVGSGFFQWQLFSHARSKKVGT